MVQKWSARGNIVRRFETSVKSAAEMHSIIIIYYYLSKTTVSRSNLGRSLGDAVDGSTLVF